MPFGRLVLDPATVEQVAWTLLHFLWQGLALAVLFAVANFALRRRSANVRYIAGCATLGLMMVAPVATFTWLDGRFDDPGPLNLSAASAAAGVKPLTRAASATSTTLVSRLSKTITHRVEPYLETMLRFWLFGVALLALRQLGTWAWLSVVLRRCARQSEDASGKWERYHDLVRRMGTRAVRFAETTLVAVPATAGWLRPIVLIPAASLLSGLRPEQLEALIAHELAHVRRHDYIVNLLQGVVETLLFFHPAVWWVSHQVREERENCCDDLAAAVIGEVDYADSLTALERVRQARREARAVFAADDDVPEHVLGATGPGPLVRRVMRLIGDPSQQLRRGPNRPAFGAAVLAIGVVCLTGAYLGAHAVSVRPDRSMDTVATVGDVLREVTAVAADDATAVARPIVTSAEEADRSFLPAYDRAVRSFSERPPADYDADAVDQLVERLATVTPDDADALQRAILSRLPLGEAFGYDRAADWTHGKGIQRGFLLDALRGEALRAHRNGESDRARQYARAMLLLAVQESPRLGWSHFRMFLSRPWFASAAQFGPRELTRLSRHAQDHDELSRIFNAYKVRIERHLQSLPERGAATPPSFGRAHEDLIALVELGSLRPDIQWEAANLARRLLRAAGEEDRRRVAADPRLWSAAQNSPHFTRWLQQAVRLDGSGGGAEPRALQFVTTAELKRKGQRTMSIEEQEEELVRRAEEKRRNRTSARPASQPATPSPATLPSARLQESPTS